MQLLTQERLEASYARCPTSKWVEGQRPRDGTGAYGLPRRVGSTDVGGSAGRYFYHSVGANRSRSTLQEERWEGACFAQWRHIQSTHYLDAVTYRNPLGSFLSVPRGNHDFYRIGWDTVIHSCMPDALPTYDELRATEELTFDDLSNRSLVEASFNWRMCRIFAECLSFATATTLLRHRYPNAPAPVLFALSALTGRIDLKIGHLGLPHPAYPNCTIPIMGSTPKGISLMRNMLWAQKEGSWNLAKLTSDRGLFGPHARQYHGHNKYWYGSERHFQASIIYNGKAVHKSGYAHTHELYKCAPSVRRKHGWSSVDFMLGVLTDGYALADKTDITKPVTVELAPHIKALPAPLQTKMTKIVEKQEGRLW